MRQHPRIPRPDDRRRGGFSIVEVAISVLLLSIGLLSIAAVIFSVERLDSSAGSDYAAHRLLMNRLVVATQEFSSASDYLTTYGNPVEFVVPRSQSSDLPVAVATLTAFAPLNGAANGVVLRAQVDYEQPFGTDSRSIEYFLRCEQP